MPESMTEAKGRRAAQREERRAAILRIAIRHFCDQGYGSTSMSTIACELGGSKGTLWSYFPSKQDLFAATLSKLIDEYAPFLALDAHEPLAPALSRYAVHFLGFTLSPKVIALNRLIIGEAPRFPEVGRIFFEQGPRRRHRALADYFERRMEQGEMRPGDAMQASAQFHHLCHYRQFMRTLWGVAAETAREEIEADAAAAVRLFLDGCRNHGEKAAQAEANAP